MDGERVPNGIRKEIVHQPDLCRCEACSGVDIYPINIAAAGKDFSTALLHCPDCGDDRLGRYPNPQVRRLIMSGTQREAIELNEDLGCMEKWGARFVVALEAGHILPEDF